MKFRPLHDRVLIEVLDSEEKTSGGIIIQQKKNLKKEKLLLLDQEQEPKMVKLYLWMLK